MHHEFKMQIFTASLIMVVRKTLLLLLLILSYNTELIKYIDVSD